jgi:hypothetical protein
MYVITCTSFIPCILDFCEKKIKVSNNLSPKYIDKGLTVVCPQNWKARAHDTTWSQIYVDHQTFFYSGQSQVLQEHKTFPHPDHPDYWGIRGYLKWYAHSSSFLRPSSILSITGRDQTGYTVDAGFCMFPQSCDAQRLQDLYSVCLMFWMRTHTVPRFTVSSEGRESLQPQVIRASHTNSNILVHGQMWVYKLSVQISLLCEIIKCLDLTCPGARTSNLSHWRRTHYHCATGSLFNILKTYWRFSKHKEKFTSSHATSTNIINKTTHQLYKFYDWSKEAAGSKHGKNIQSQNYHLKNCIIRTK